MNNGTEPNLPQSPQPANELSLQSEIDTENSLETPAGTPSATQPVDVEPPKRMPRRRIIGLALLVIGLVATGLLVLYSINANKKQNDESARLLAIANRIKPQSIGLPALSKQLASTSTPELSTLTINGQANVSNSLVLQPTSEPTNATTGQIYYDQDTDRLAFYNGEQFINLQGAVSTQVINVIGGDTITNIVAGDTITNITNISGGGLSGNGTVGALAMFTGGTTLGDSLITQTGSSLNVGSNATGIQIGNSAANHTIQMGTGAGVQQVTIGSGNTSSATTIQAGTGNLSLHTGDNTGVSGDISITTGDSSTTASGNITIDTGSSIITGEVVENKTFEGGLENMVTWFGSTLATTSDQARSGAQSLEVTTTDPFWGAIELLPGTSVVPGHQYFFSIWVRAGSNPRTINANVVWQGTGGQFVPLNSVVDNTTGWTELTGVGAAPATATSAYFRTSSSGATVGEIHYFDDITMTDLSSSAAISALNIGNTNAKTITIGNLTQIGATSINGGSGVHINSGAASTTVVGGVVSLTGNAASSFSTTSGGLTLTSAAAASWGVGSEPNGDGGSLTLYAGNAGGGNFNGGDLMLRGGNPAGTGLAGGVVVANATDSANAFSIQNSSSAPLFAADTSTMTITVAGTAASFGTLTLDNAHFKSTQTTAPTIATPTNCGTTPTAAVATGSTDSAGALTITTGTGGTSSTCDTVVTFDKPYGAAPKSILVGGKTDAGSAARQIYVSAADVTSFTISFGTSAGGADNTAYEFNYWVVE